MANPYPAITFQVNLATVDAANFLTPDQYSQTPSYGRALTDQQSNNRVTFIPGLEICGNRELKHGQQFTEYGLKAVYLKKTYADVDHPILTVLSWV
jgi:hypothetical protein